jgi:group I intron endonuclease
MLNSSGVYTITNLKNGKCYVGSALSFRRRWYEHQSYFRRGVHHAKHLQHAWNKYGPEAFEFKPLLICAPKDLLMYEQRAMDTLKPEYNTAPTAGNTLGVKLSPEAIAKMVAYRTGRKQDPEHVAKRAAGLRGQTRTAEAKERMSIAATGRECTPETRAKLAAHNTGKTMPAETRAKIGDALRGRTHGTPGAPISAEHKARISAANKGTRKTPETIARMCVAAKARVQRQKDFIATVFAVAGTFVGGQAL